MLRTIATILVVAAISGWISRGEQAVGVSPYPTDWIRTADGWESRSVVQPQHRMAPPPPLHPVVIAGFQLLASLLFLAAFPASVRSLAPVAARNLPRGHLRQATPATVRV